MVNLSLATDCAKQFGPKRCFQHRPALTKMIVEGSNMANPQLPSPQDLRKLLDYDPQTGLLTWRARGDDLVPDRGYQNRFNRQFAGKEALQYIGSHGYRCGSIFDRSVRAHRVAFAIYHGRWPEGDVDHINGVRSDNRICNLREVTKSENRRNVRARSDNTSGHAGVYWRPDLRKWSARISVDGKWVTLGHFPQLNDAIAARHAAQIERGFTARHGKARNP